jgi:hypothetical protein
LDKLPNERESREGHPHERESEWYYKRTNFWDVKPFSLVEVYRYFRGTVQPPFFGPKVKPQEQAEHFFYPTFLLLKK